jgi:hypothetical protein
MTMNNETPPLLSTVGFRCKKCGYLGPVHRDVIGHTLACPSCSCEAFRHEEGISDKLERIEKENAQLCRELEAARHEREQAVQESNRRDQKWMDGIDSICGRKLRYTLATINDAPGFDLVPDLQDFITSLKSQLSKAEGERNRMREALKDCIEKLERYGNRQGSKRMVGKSFGEGMKDNAANEGQHYPAVQSCIDRARNCLQPLPQTEGRESKLESALKELFAEVNGEAPRLLDDDCGGNGRLYMEIKELLAPSPVSEKGPVDSPEGLRPRIEK